MKRQGDNIVDQPAVKKPDVSVSTDLRSKIGAKLQTLLNGITTDSRLSARNRRRLYEDLFGETQHSEIIIDHPTIVVKTEAPEVEECSNDSSTLFNSHNFLESAKNRLTELLNKQQEGASKFRDKGNENALSSNKNHSSSSSKSRSHQNQSLHKSQSLSSNTSNKKQKRSNSKECSNSSSDVKSSQVHLKDLVVVVEDFMNSENRTKFTTENQNNESCSANLQSKLISKKVGHTVAKVNITSEETNSFASNDATDVSIIESTSTISQSNAYSQIPADECYFYENNPELNICRPESSESSGSVLLNDHSPSKVIELADVLFETGETTNQIPYDNEDDSEFIDDPTIPQVIVDLKVGETEVGETISSDSNHNLSTENPDADVVLLCVKRPTHEVITLEDNDDSDDDVVEEVHECDQCGKAFLAKSLLNFHIRMHRSDFSISPSSSSHSFS